METIILTDIFTQEELQKYFNILNPVICSTHNKPAKLYYENGILKPNFCCNELVMRVRIQISKEIAKQNL